MDEEPSLRVGVLTGTGRAFCAGADLKGILLLKLSSFNSLSVEEVGLQLRYLYMASSLDLRHYSSLPRIIFNKANAIVQNGIPKPAIQGKRPLSHLQVSEA